VTKPFNSAELLARVKTHLELKRTREELIRRNKELIKTKKDLEISALTDPLTKLLNRRAILTHIQYEKNRFERNRKPFTLLLGDIDGFKGFNDKYGHECGDYVLVLVAQTMKSLVRKVDSVARWGGEEFLLLLPDTGLEGGRTTAEKIRQSIASHTFNYNQIPLTVTMTFGVSTFAYSCSQDIDDCIRSVDLVMYEGKQKGKNCVVTARKK
jgi:diguanylate cyclase (GGDEF)-like protein